MSTTTEPRYPIDFLVATLFLSPIPSIFLLAWLAPDATLVEVLAPYLGLITLFSTLIAIGINWLDDFRAWKPHLLIIDADNFYDDLDDEPYHAPMRFRGAIEFRRCPTRDTTDVTGISIYDSPCGYDISLYSHTEHDLPF